jgi:D-arabinan exo alpha-(1,3)/(1,5)-arabinofuranosidase (non-reducing end)
MNEPSRRRRFLAAFGGAAAALSANRVLAAPNQAAQSPSAAATSGVTIPNYARAQDYQTLKQSTYDRSGGNEDFRRITPGGTLEVFQSSGPGVITHIWFTIATESGHHLKELVLRMHWEGNAKPSVEVPVGDFFGLNLGEYFVYQSAFLNCSSVKALNSYFAMPFRRSARITVTNEGSLPVKAFYSNIDYKLVPTLPDDALYFHAQYRQATPNKPVTFSSEDHELNPSGERNYVFLESRGKGQVMGVTMGVVQTSDRWFGEGDEMIFIDNESKPAITGTGTEDYFCGAWDFAGGADAVRFHHLYNGAPYIAIHERMGGRYCLYRWHADNPIAFQRYLKHTIEHGHADDRADCFYSVGYWYQSEPYTDFPALPDAAARLPTVRLG